MNGFSWRAAFRIAWREGRAAKGKFLFVILAVAAGVACVTGVRGFSQAFRGMLLREARVLMAADLSVRIFEAPTPHQTAAMTGLERRGVARTPIVETVSMVAVENAPDPVLVSVKAVDPSLYPFYGEIRLDPPGRLADVLTRDAIAVSGDTILRLGTSIGSRLRLGEEEFRVAAIVTVEPDRMTGSLNVGPRMMLSHEAMKRSGIMQPGSRASHRFLFRLAPGAPTVEEARAILKRAFPEAMIADYRETHPLITRGLDRATTFLTLVSLISLVVGALGVAAAMHSHLRRRMDAIAVMKCLGARSSQIVRIYLLQTVLLGLAGSLIGVALGLAVQAIFPALIAKFFPQRPPVRLDLLSSLQGLGAGLLTTLLFTWPPLAGLRRVKPGLILRRDMPEARPSWSERRRAFRSTAAGSLSILAGLALLAASLAGGTSDAVRLGAWFAGGLFVSLAALAGCAKLLLNGFRGVVQRAPFQLPPTVRHAIANLYRPGTQAPFIMAALGLGVTFTLTVVLIQRSMLTEMFRSAPPGMANVFVINITERERAGLLELLNRQRGVEVPLEVVAAVPARLQSVDGILVEKLPIQSRGRRFLRTRSVTSARDKPSYTEIVRGAWWNTGDPGGVQVSVAEEAAGILGVKPGSRVDFTSSGRTISATVASVHRTESVRPGANIEFIFTAGTLDGLPAIYYGGMRVHPAAVAALQRAAYRAYPTVTVVNAADVLEIVQEVVDQVALVVRFVSFFAIVAGAVVLASSVAGTQFRRVREVAVLKTLGATRRCVAAIFSLELTVLGALAGLAGSVLATGLSAVLLNRFFETGFRLDLMPNLLAIALTALVATAGGWAAGYRLLAQKPMEVLRNE